ncbi:nnp-1 protein putative nuclear protein 1 nop52 [Anaeramoeba flamelloides]|uniref:Nnp-1 protein putative nuclear protein 1 nop52 n=1 Tax=Anaeramoeba flamelloides TaxID=1746091 RepID=A0AAV7ZQH4_9EUKA|nr:nnp-1 protein putative nuclear protein 1 nop52 [Anaeramoeba flamelloides]
MNTSQRLVLLTPLKFGSFTVHPTLPFLALLTEQYEILIWNYNLGRKEKIISLQPYLKSNQNSKTKFEEGVCSLQFYDQTTNTAFDYVYQIKRNTNNNFQEHGNNQKEQMLVLVLNNEIYLWYLNRSNMIVKFKTKVFLKKSKITCVEILQFLPLIYIGTNNGELILFNFLTNRSRSIMAPSAKPIISLKMILLKQIIQKQITLREKKEMERRKVKSEKDQEQQIQKQKQKDKQFQSLNNSSMLNTHNRINRLGNNNQNLKPNPNPNQNKLNPSGRKKTINLRTKVFAIVVAKGDGEVTLLPILESNFPKVKIQHQGSKEVYRLAYSTKIQCLFLIYADKSTALISISERFKIQILAEMRPKYDLFDVLPTTKPDNSFLVSDQNGVLYHYTLAINNSFSIVKICNLYSLFSISKKSKALLVNEKNNKIKLFSISMNFIDPDTKFFCTNLGIGSITWKYPFLGQTTTLNRINLTNSNSNSNNNDNNNNINNNNNDNDNNNNNNNLNQINHKIIKQNYLLWKSKKQIFEIKLENILLYFKKIKKIQFHISNIKKFSKEKIQLKNFDNNYSITSSSCGNYFSLFWKVLKIVEIYNFQSNKCILKKKCESFIWNTNNDGCQFALLLNQNDDEESISINESEENNRNEKGGIKKTKKKKKRKQNQKTTTKTATKKCYKMVIQYISSENKISNPITFPIPTNQKIEKIFGGKFLGIQFGINIKSNQNEDQKLNNFQLYNWDTLKPISSFLKAPVEINYNSTGEFVWFKYLKDYSVLLQIAHNFQIIKSFHFIINSVFWYNLTLFVITPSSIISLFPHDTDFQQITIATFDVFTSPSSSNSHSWKTHYSQSSSISSSTNLSPSPSSASLSSTFSSTVHSLSKSLSIMTAPFSIKNHFLNNFYNLFTLNIQRPIGQLKIIGIITDRLLIVDQQMQLHILRLYSPILKFMMLIQANNPKQAIKWISFINTKYYHTIAKILTDRGFIEYALSIPDLSPSYKIKICYKYKQFNIGYKILKSITVSDYNLKLSKRIIKFANKLIKFSVNLNKNFFHINNNFENQENIQNDEDTNKDRTGVKYTIGNDNEKINVQLKNNLIIIEHAFWKAVKMNPKYASNLGIFYYQSNQKNKLLQFIKWCQVMDNEQYITINVLVNKDKNVKNNIPHNFFLNSKSDKFTKIYGVTEFEFINN